MQEYEKKTINEVVEKINDTYFLPDIQRDFVWKPDAIYKLFDSLMRQYPINTFLFWQLDGKTISKNNYKKIEFVKESKQDSYSVNTSINPDKTYFLVLDGQQRLTTFYLVLKGDYFMNKTDTTPRDLYFNILSGKDEDEEDGILYEFKFFDRKKGGDFLFKKKSRKTKEKIIKLWVSVKAIYQISDTVGFLELEKFCAALESTHKIKLTKEQQNSVYVLKEQLRNQRIINFFPEKEDNYDKVLDIFVRTNSGGTKLEYSDLLFANIKAIWKDAREEFDKLLDSINDSGRYDFEKDNILKTILLLNASAVTEVKYKTKNFKPALISKVKDPKYWSKLCDAFKITIDLLSDLFLITDKKLLSANNAIIPIVYWFFINDYKAFGTEKNCIATSDPNLAVMRVWLIKSLLSGLWAGQSDSILMKCKEVIDENPTVFNGKELENRISNETKKDMDYDLNRIEKVKYLDPDSYLILSIVYKSTITYKPISPRNKPQQDHLFSKDELKGKYPEELINSIFNIRFVGATPNQSKSGKPFEEWIKTQTSEERAMHLIPDGDWKMDKFKDFLDKRKELIFKNFSY